MTSQAAPRTARARVRDELTQEIKDIARRELAAQGSAALSLRAIAREIGMVSSAVYRYFPSRDDLLTALIIDAYNAVGDAAEQAESLPRRSDFVGRWMAVCSATRTWAVAHPQEYALIFGSPVPGYSAPVNTVDPAARIPLRLLHVLTDAVAAGYELKAGAQRIPRSVRTDLKALRELVAPSLPEPHLARATMAWTQLVGSISFELFGHLHNVIHDYQAYFDFQMRAICQDIGLE